MANSERPRTVPYTITNSRSVLPVPWQAPDEANFMKIGQPPSLAQVGPSAAAAARVVLQDHLVAAAAIARQVVRAAALQARKSRSKQHKRPELSAPAASLLVFKRKDQWNDKIAG
jgi:hypothetical protein